MTDRRELETLVKKMNSLNLYSWLVEDTNGYVIGVDSQAFRNGMVLSPISAAEKMRGW